jgi:DNA-binding NarL/FixJ family response regulator
VAWAAQATDELARVNLRPSAPDGLTETEQPVAGLAATGLTNREVAERMFLAVKTVEANLARAYRKMGIRSRAELGARMGGRPVALHDEPAHAATVGASTGPMPGGAP